MRHALCAMPHVERDMEQKATIRAKGNSFDGKSEQIVNAELTAGMVEAVAVLERKVKENTPVGVYGAQGGLLASISGEVTGKGTPMIKGVVGSSSPYGEVIEKGRRAGKGWPPPGVLLRWIELKFGISEEEAHKVEFAVRRKIGQKGFEGAHMFERAFNEGWPTLQSIFERRGFEIARKLSQ